MRRLIIPLCAVNYWPVKMYLASVIKILMDAKIVDRGELRALTLQMYESESIRRYKKSVDDLFDEIDQYLDDIQS